MRIGRERIEAILTTLVWASASLVASCSFDTSPRVPSQNLPHATVGGIGGHGSGGAQHSSVGDGGPHDDAGDPGTGADGSGGAGADGSGGDSAGGASGDSASGGKGGGGTGGKTATSFCKDPAHDGMDCSDGFDCTTGEHCVDLLCKSGKLTSCASMDDQCNTGVCDVSADECATMPAHEGEACDDGLFCTTGERCHAGQCDGGQERVCPALDDDCSQAACDESIKACALETTNEGLACDDGKSCSAGETCHAGECTATWCRARTECVLACPAQCDCDVQCHDAARCETSCAMNTECTLDCTSVDDCASDCAAGSTCNIDCSESGKCETRCRPGSTCDIQCAFATKCLLGCETNATCDVDCRDALDCRDFTCDPGAHCLLRCGDNDKCSFKGDNPCGGAVMECDGGVLVCGRDCP
jgi:hypothetical protein